MIRRLDAPFFRQVDPFFVACVSLALKIENHSTHYLWWACYLLIGKWRQRHCGKKIELHTLHSAVAGFLFMLYARHYLAPWNQSIRVGSISWNAEKCTQHCRLQQQKTTTTIPCDFSHPRQICTKKNICIVLRAAVQVPLQIWKTNENTHLHIEKWPNRNAKHSEICPIRQIKNLP